MTLARRRVPPPPLPPSIVDVLLRGWSGPAVEDDEASCFEVFSLTESALAETWRLHRDALMNEAARRGIAEPWGVRFECVTPWRRLR